MNNLASTYGAPGQMKRTVAPQEKILDARRRMNIRIYWRACNLAVIYKGKSASGSTAGGAQGGRIILDGEDGLLAILRALWRRGLFG
jgi:hypothetical protein